MYLTAVKPLKPSLGNKLVLQVSESGDWGAALCHEHHTKRLSGSVKRCAMINTYNVPQDISHEIQKDSTSATRKELVSAGKALCVLYQRAMVSSNKERMQPPSHAVSLAESVREYHLSPSR